jgi:type I restriction enzyme S subunit
VTVGHVGTTTPYYRDEGVLFLRTQNVGESGLVLDDKKYITPAFHAALKKSEVRAGDILMSRVITHTVHCALVPYGLGPANCANVVLVRPASHLMSEYLAHYIRSGEAQEHLLARKVGSAQLVVNTTVVRNWPVPVPPLDEQKRIVGVLDEAFESIAAAKANAERSLRNAGGLFESYLASVFNERTRNWVEARIGEVIKFIDYRGKTPVKTSSGVRLITAKNVKMGYLQGEPMEFIASSNYGGWMTRGIPQEGDVLFTTEAPLANVAQLNTSEKVAFAQRIIIMQPEKAILDSAFLKYLLMSSPVQRRIRAKGTGATVQGIKAQLLKLIEISFPKALAEQRLIVAKLDELREETQRLESIHQQKLTALEELKKSLLHQAFTGKL